MPLHIVERPALALIGLHLQTQPMSPDIPALWPRFMARVHEIEARRTEPGVTYGVMESDPGDMRRLAYWAAVAVRASDAPPSGMVGLTLPGGDYACFRYPFGRLGEGYGEIFETLMPSSDHVQRPGPLFERYDEAFDPEDPQAIVEIYVPVQRQGG